MANYVPTVATNLGALNISPFLPVPHLPNIVAEWAAIIPLVCHLASYKHDYQLLGHVALTGRISVDLLPRLGVLAGIARLLNKGPEFIDEASSKGFANRKVWDVKWGGTFPCANGAASAMIARYALKNKTKSTMKMPDTIPSTHQQPESHQSLRPTAPVATTSSQAQAHNSEDQTQTGAMPAGGTPPAQHRRYQTLHVLRFSRRPLRYSWFHQIHDISTSATCEALGHILIAALVVVLMLFGAFGTSTSLICGSVSQLACRCSKLVRPQGYLKSNEEDVQCCMLYSIHQNACVWYLFVGDRGVVDSLLNKTMITFPDGSRRLTLGSFLFFTHCVQLLAMTFVAAQKGWDGISLVVFMFINAIWRWTRCDTLTVKHWLEAEGVDIEAKSFDFTGRTMMLGAVQAFNGGNRKDWMDEILTPHPRRDAWLSRLCCLQEDDLEKGDSLRGSGNWTAHDWESIRRSADLAFAAASILKSEMRQTEGA